MLDAAGEYVEIGVGREVAGDPEGDGATVGEDRDPGAERGRDRNVRDDLDEPAAHPVQRLLRAWHVRGDGDDLTLGQAERQPDAPGRERVQAVTAHPDQRLA